MTTGCCEAAYFSDQQSNRSLIQPPSLKKSSLDNVSSLNRSLYAVIVPSWDTTYT